MESEHFSHISRCLTTLNQTNLYFGFSFCQEDYILHFIKSILSTNFLFRAKLWSNKSDVYVFGFYRQTELQCAPVGYDHENHSTWCLQRLWKYVPQNHDLTEEKLGASVIKQYDNLHTVFICSFTLFSALTYYPWQQVHYLFTIICWFIELTINFKAKWPNRNVWISKGERNTIELL